MKNERKYLKFEPRVVMPENTLRLKTLLIERIKVGAINDLFTADMLHKKGQISCPTCGSAIDEYHKDRCQNEMCPRCGDTKSVCKCCDSYAVTYTSEPTYFDESKPHSNDAFNALMSHINTRMDVVDSKLDKVMDKISKPTYPLISGMKKKEIQDPPYMNEYLNNTAETLR